MRIINRLTKKKEEIIVIRSSWEEEVGEGCFYICIYYKYYGNQIGYLKATQQGVEISSDDFVIHNKRYRNQDIGTKLIHEFLDKCVEYWMHYIHGNLSIADNIEFNKCFMLSSDLQ